MRKHYINFERAGVPLLLEITCIIVIDHLEGHGNDATT
jgi:hypothetical protein